MAKLAQNFAKYMVTARLNATGIVEKPDVIGAVFGQTEGLIGQDLDLRELQRTGRIGRIEVNIKNSKGRSYAEITIPSSLDASETALIAASLETIEKVGPCDAQIDVMKVEDVRTQKRKYLIDRARDILKTIVQEGAPDAQKLSEMVRQAVRTCEIISYQGLSAGPGINDSDEIIVVEGRADVINLLKNGVTNAIAIEGSKIPDAIISLAKQKITTALLDGDRGGDLILKRLFEVTDIDFVARAETGKEVEELTKKELHKSLREKIPADQLLKADTRDYRDIQDRKRKDFAKEYEKGFDFEEQSEEVAEMDEKTKTKLLGLLEDLMGTRAVYLLDKDNNVLTKTPIAELSLILNDFKSAETMVIDSKINQQLVDLALQYRIKALVGMGYTEKVQSASSLKILTMEDM